MGPADKVPVMSNADEEQGCIQEGLVLQRIVSAKGEDRVKRHEGCGQREQKGLFYDYLRIQAGWRPRSHPGAWPRQDQPATPQRRQSRDSKLTLRRKERNADQEQV